MIVGCDQKSGGKSDEISRIETENLAAKADPTQKQGGASATRAVTANQKMNLSSFMEKTSTKMALTNFNTEH
jgi:hypothetical protein